MKEQIFNLKRINGVWIVVENGIVIFKSKALSLAFDFITYSYDQLSGVQ